MTRCDGTLVRRHSSEVSISHGSSALRCPALLCASLFCFALPAPALHFPFRLLAALHCPTLLYPNLPYPTLLYPNLPYSALPYPTLTYPNLPYSTLGADPAHEDALGYDALELARRRGHTVTVGVIEAAAAAALALSADGSSLLKRCAQALGQMRGLGVRGQGLRVEG